MTKQYRKKPAVVDAMMFPRGGRAQRGVVNWIKDNGGDARLYDGWFQRVEEPLEDGSYFYWSKVHILTLEGDMTANIGDYIIKGVQGEFYPCKPEIFHQTYEEVN